ncbi:histone-fold-containing protein [Lipomyces japonicus]|uniref:histone-fold-containing protein n=1 Tax=Lipomyces japonicus TaxID=56871 RepID=UPI0034CE8725
MPLKGHRNADKSAKATTDSGAVDESQRDVDAGNSGIEDYLLPRATVSRLAKSTLPPNTSIQKDAMTALSKGSTVFINYLTSTANDITVQNGRKTVNPNDVYEALEVLALDGLIPRVRQEVDKFIEASQSKKTKLKAVPKEAEKQEFTQIVPESPDTNDRDYKKLKVTNGNGAVVKSSSKDDDETEVEEDEEEEEHETEEQDGEEEEQDGEDDHEEDEDSADGDATTEIDPDRTLDLEDEDDKPRRTNLLTKDVDVIGSEDEDSD